MMKKILTKDLNVSQETKEKMSRIREKIKEQQAKGKGLPKIPNAPFKLGR